MNEMGFTVQEYYDNYKKAIRVALKPNKAIGKKVSLLTQPKKYANEDPQVLTDGAIGGSSFYANWLGFEGNDMKVVVDFEKPIALNSISIAFLQVTNHVVFFPQEVTFYSSEDNTIFHKIGSVNNKYPLSKSSKVNDIQYFDLYFDTTNTQYLKIVGTNMKTPPYWHHATGTKAWIFADEIIVN